MSKSEVRKLVRWGSSNTLVVSIPRSWVRKYNLTEDDEIRIMELPDGRLVLAPVKISLESEQKIVVSLNTLSDAESLRRIIKMNYLRGYDVIRLTAEHPILDSVRQTVINTVDSLVGFEITESGTKYIEVRDVLSLKEANLSLLVKIISQRTYELLSHLLMLLKGNTLDELLLKKIMDMHNLIFSYCLRIHRQVRKAIKYPLLLQRMGIEYSEALNFTFFARDIENISNVALASAMAIKKYGVEQANPRLISFAEQINTIVQSITRIFLFKKTKSVEDVLKRAEQLYSEKRDIENMLDKMSFERTTISLQICLDNYEKIIGYGKNILELSQT